MLASSNATFQGEDRVNILADQRMERLKFRHTQVCQIASALFTRTHSMSHRFVCITKWQPLLDKIISQIGRRRIALHGGFPHGFRLNPNTRDHIDEYSERVAYGVS